MVNLDLEKAEEAKIKLPASVRSSKKQESSRKISTFALLTTPKHLIGSQQNVENSLRDGNTRPPYLPPEKSISRTRTTVRTRDGTMDWFQIGKGVHQGCISSCLFNFYEEHIMKNARID